MQVPVSPEVNALLDDAVTLSARRGIHFVGVEHVYEVLVEQSDLLPHSVTESHRDALRAALHVLLEEAWAGTMPVSGVEVFYTPRCAEAAKEAARLASSMENPQPAAGHLLLAILSDPLAAPSRALDRLGLARQEVVADLRKALSTRGHKSGTARHTATGGDSATAPASAQTKAPIRPEPGTQNEEPRERATLASVTRDLTQAAREGRIESAVGRSREMFHILEVLARKNKNNVIIVGEAGVGKTRIVEGLARLGAKTHTDELMPYRIVELNLASLMSGTQYRGAFEEKLSGLIDELKADPNTVLFIDEIHLIMGAGSTEGGGIDFANLLKPALARGEIRCIGATTMQEYRKFIEKDPAMERRFQLVRIAPLSASACWQVLKRLRPSLEKHHEVHIGKRALHAAITLTERYLPQRHLPDKAIDVLDQACARYRLKAIAAKNNPGMFPHAPESGASAKVTPHDIRKVVSRLAAVPIEEITAEERRRVGNLERKLNRRIIGQEQAVSKVVAAVKRARAGLADPNRPDSVMLFLGPTGVGKTQLAKALSEAVFGAAKHLITFDMSEYIEQHSVSRLIGAPPGYVGSEEEGRLTGAVRNAPFSILLFDEVEKAHRRVFDLFLPILDEGRLKDSRGRDVSFRNCIIIFTSNIGSERLRRPEQGETRHTEPTALMEALHQHFRPEFINRIDEVVPFYPLVFEDIRRILELALQDLTRRLAEKEMELHVFQGAFEHLAEQGYSAQFGARELRRAVERLVVNPISAMILDQTFGAGDRIEVLVEGDRLEIRRAAKKEAV
ncbi:MAG: ATP-dependent Clp protease ATP-binding subunit [bacterium]|nr:ATP-dependent Clp protease ATP-binding subunit [bacterium]